MNKKIIVLIFLIIGTSDILISVYESYVPYIGICSIMLVIAYILRIKIHKIVGVYFILFCIFDINESIKWGHIPYIGIASIMLGIVLYKNVFIAILFSELVFLILLIPFLYALKVFVFDSNEPMHGYFSLVNSIMFLLSVMVCLLLERFNLLKSSIPGES